MIKLSRVFNERYRKLSTHCLPGIIKAQEQDFGIFMQQTCPNRISSLIDVLMTAKYSPSCASTSQNQLIRNMTAFHWTTRSYASAS